MSLYGCARLAPDHRHPHASGHRFAESPRHSPARNQQQRRIDLMNVPRVDQGPRGIVDHHHIFGRRSGFGQSLKTSVHGFLARRAPDVVMTSARPAVAWANGASWPAPMATMTPAVSSNAKKPRSTSGSWVFQPDRHIAWGPVRQNVCPCHRQQSTPTGAAEYSSLSRSSFKKRPCKAIGRRPRHNLA